jgi:hypothetical protein
MVMSTTITQGFDTLRQNLEITGLQEATVSTRQRNVREAIEAELTVLDSFLTGSYKRSTMIAPLSGADVDIFAVLHSSYYDPNGAAALLDRVKGLLRKTYTRTPEISRSGQAVTITFTDFQVDVVPGFHRKGGGFLIPNSRSQQWISTDPKQHVRLWSEANAAHNGNLVPLIKMIKQWNRCHSSLLRSFHLETLIFNVLTNVTISDFPSGARWVFGKIHAAVQQAVADPAGYSGDLGAYLDSQLKINEVCTRLNTAYQQACEAEQLEAQGRTDLAYAKWQMIFGDKCPPFRG